LAIVEILVRIKRNPRWEILADSLCVSIKRKALSGYLWRLANIYWQSWLSAFAISRLGEKRYRAIVGGRLPYIGCHDYLLLLLLASEKSLIGLLLEVGCRTSAVMYY